MRSSDLIAPLALLLAACQPQSPATGTTPAADAVAVGNVAAVNAVALPPPVVELKGTSAVATGQPPSTLSLAVETTIEPGSSFRVELPVALADARLSLLDAGDAMVPSAGSREIGQATLLTLKPAVALPPGAHLRLRIDGAATRELHGADGRRFAPLEWSVLVTGDAEPARGAARRKLQR
jgi:hypothetical protein